VPLWADTARLLRAWFRELGDDGNGVAFSGIRGPASSRDGVDHLLRRAVVTAAAACPSLGVKKVSQHVLHHSTTMYLFLAGVDMAVVALWLEHEPRDDPHLRRSRPRDQGAGAQQAGAHAKHARSLSRRRQNPDVSRP
jgi:integrase